MAAGGLIGLPGHHERRKVCEYGRAGARARREPWENAARSAPRRSPLLFARP
jgi:hypothetical protein